MCSDSVGCDRWMRSAARLKLCARDREEDFQLSDRHRSYPIVSITTMYWTLYHSASYDKGRRCSMIFRHFLSPKTGCASYLLG